MNPLYRKFKVPRLFGAPAVHSEESVTVSMDDDEPIDIFTEDVLSVDMGATHAVQKYQATQTGGAEGGRRRWENDPDHDWRKEDTIRMFIEYREKHPGAKPADWIRTLDSSAPHSSTLYIHLKKNT